MCLSRSGPPAQGDLQQIHGTQFEAPAAVNRRWLGRDMENAGEGGERSGVQAQLRGEGQQIYTDG